MDLLALTQECAPWVAHETMAAIIKTESAFRHLAIGINGGAKLVRQPKTKEEAVVTANWLITNGYSIDMGLGQINSSNLSKTNLSIEDAFDPCKNIAAAATILRNNYLIASRKTSEKQTALYAALSAYNTGSFSKGFSNGYVQKVINNAGAAIPTIPAPEKKTHQKRTEKTAKNKVNRDTHHPSQTTDANVYRTPNNNVMVY